MDNRQLALALSAGALAFGTALRDAAGTETQSIAAEPDLFSANLKAVASDGVRNPFGVLRYFDDIGAGQSYSSWVPLWGGFGGAAHSDEGLSDDTVPVDRPNFASAPEVLRPNGLDGVFYGCTFPDTPPPAPWVNADITEYGYPAGSKLPTWIDGQVLMQRPQDLQPNEFIKSWVVVHDKGEDLAMGGVSGGAVVANNVTDPAIIAQAKAAGVLRVINGVNLVLLGFVTDQNSRFPYQGEQRNSSDFVSLYDLWYAVTEGGSAHA